MASSSASIFDPHRFINENAQVYYSEMGNRRIIHELQFNPSPDDGDLTQQIDALGWSAFAKQQGEANNTIVREFYANIKASEHHGTVSIRGKAVSYSADAINTALQITRRQPDEYTMFMDAGPDYTAMIRELGPPNARWNYSSVNPDVPTHLMISQCLNRYANAWSKFIRHNLNPSSNKSELTRDRVALLYCILKGMRIDVGKIIHTNIRHAATGSDHVALVHPVLITKLCARARVPIYRSDTTGKQMDFNSSKILKIAQLPGTMPRSNGFGFEFTEPIDIPPLPASPPRRDDPIPPPPTPNAPPPHQYDLNTIGNMLQDLSVRMEAIVARMNVHEARRERWERRVTRRIADIQERQQLQAHYAFLYDQAFDEDDPVYPEFPTQLILSYNSPDEGEEPDA